MYGDQPKLSSAKHTNNENHVNFEKELIYTYQFIYLCSALPFMFGAIIFQGQSSFDLQ
jgi:hypothetical protein